MSTFQVTIFLGMNSLSDCAEARRRHYSLTSSFFATFDALNILGYRTLGKELDFCLSALRTAKNYTKGYSDTQAKVREATSNDPWGPSGTQMNELAQLTYNQGDFVEIMEMLDKRLNDKGKNWRHVFKALTVLDYLLHAGSENVVIYFKDNIYVIKTLKEFQFIDDAQKDQGANVRQKAKDITNLLQDDARLRQERKSRASMRDRMVTGRGLDDEEEDFGARRSHSTPPVAQSRRPRDDDEMRKAIEESKRSLEQDRARQTRQNAEDSDLAKALKLSQEEEEARKRAFAGNGDSLFDEQNQLINFNDPQPSTIQPQFTSFNPYALQMQQQQLLQQQQAEWEMQQQQLALQQQQAQQEEMMRQQAAQEEFMRQQQAQQLFLQQQQEQQQQQALWEQQQQQQQWLMQQQAQQQPIQAQPTGFGSKNPFAFQQQPQPAPSPPVASVPSFSASTPDLHSQRPQQPRFGAIEEEEEDPALLANTRANSRRPHDDGKNAHLAALIGNREDGIDTFGNFGNLRLGHSATGGNNIAPLVGQRTGTGLNPFASMQQQRLQGQATGANPDQPFFSI
ncbi:ENTH-domain-containing protein [Clavulina sp. PMI_390]|nr:ENTH-domain-containing protein [Clavulina sp. PMI_390]